MLNLERQNAILDFLTKNKSATVNQLSNTLYASTATVRRDLALMEKQGIIQRSHGGAILCQSTNAETSLVIREQHHTKEKRIIAESAVQFLQNSSSIFLDSSSTATMLIPHLAKLHNLSIITTGLKNALLLAETTSAKIYLPGGIVNSNSNSIIGIDTVSYLGALNPDIAFFSCSGIDNNGIITDGALEQSLLKRQVISTAKKSILLCDSSKIGKQYLCKICNLKDIHYLITDKKPEITLLTAVNNSGCKAIY